MTERPIGVIYRPEFPLAGLADAARRAERAGFSSFWVFEDCFWTGGVATAAVALTATERIQVGIGIMPTVGRNPAIAAMELATLARLFPGRLLPGFGNGVQAWMRQIGAAAPSPLAALDETLTAVRGLLAGETVSLDGRTVQLDAVRLAAPPETVPVVYAGVQGPKSLEIAGRAAGGTILSEPLSVDYIRAARERIAVGQAAAGRTGHHPVIGYSWTRLADDDGTAREALRPTVAAGITTYARTLVEPTGLLPEADALRAESSDDADFARRVPNDWLDRLSIAGTAERCAGRIDELFAAGLDHVVLLFGTEAADWAGQVDRAGRDLLPLLRSSRVEPAHLARVAGRNPTPDSAPDERGEPDPAGAVRRHPID